MLDREAARAIAAAYIDQLSGTGDRRIELAVLDDATREKPYGWVFFYQSVRYLRTGAVSDAVAGNAPMLVTKDGAVHVLGTAEPTDAYLERFEKTGTPHARPIRRLHQREMPGDR